MSVGELLALPLVGGVGVGHDADGAVRGTAGQDQPELVRGPGHRVDRGVVVRVFVEFGPPAGGVLAPKQDLEYQRESGQSRTGFVFFLAYYLSVVGAGGEDVAVLGVGPGHLPHGSLVSLEVGDQRLNPALLQLEDLDRPVRGRRGQPSAVVVHLGVVDHVLVTRVNGAFHGHHSGTDYKNKEGWVRSGTPVVEMTLGIGRS